MTLFTDACLPLWQYIEAECLCGLRERPNGTPTLSSHHRYIGCCKLTPLTTSGSLPNPRFRFFSSVTTPAISPKYPGVSSTD